MVVAIVAASTLAACQSTVRTHGNRLAEEELARIRPGATSQGEVAALLGTPSARDPFDARNWYYIERRIRRSTFYNSTLTKQEVVRISFDDRGIVAAVEIFDVDDAHQVAFVEDETETGGNDLSLIQQFVGNIGRFNPPTN